MDKKELQIIQELMEELQDQMQMSESDFDERLGRKKPDVEILKVEGEMPESKEHEEMEPEDEMMPEMMDSDESLKHRIMKLRE